MAVVPSTQAASLAGRRRTGLIIGVIAAVLVVLGGTTTTAVVLNHRADVAANERKAEAAQKAEEKRQAAEQRKAEEEAAALNKAHATYTACTSQLNPLMTALRNIDARLDVGLSQAELSDMLGKASIAYSRINVDTLGNGSCLSAGAKLEAAFNTYNGTVGSWQDCIYDYSCDVDADVLPGMQQKWTKASGLIDQAQKLVATLDPDGATYDENAAGDSV